MGDSRSEAGWFPHRNAAALRLIIVMIRNWMRMLLAILVGNLTYFLLLPVLPGYLKHHIFTFDPGVVLDLMLCVTAYILIRLI